LCRVHRCRHTALLTPAFLDRLGLSQRNKVLDLKDRFRCREVMPGHGAVSIKWGQNAS
jgi:hypothetical protein